MSETEKGTGEIAWLDLTVEDADSIRGFYQEVIGWTSSPVDMGDYNDFCMISPKSGEAAAGVCFARGANADLPPVWLAYILVDDVAHSVERCETLGGRVIAGPKDMGPHGTYCIIEDPAGAAIALFQHPKTA